MVGVGEASGVAGRGVEVGWAVGEGVATGTAGEDVAVEGVSGVGVSTRPQPVNKQTMINP